MSEKQNISGHLAAFAIFTELYNMGKNDVFLIIAEFIKEIISERALYSFALNKIVDLLKTEYMFDGIPSSVVKTSLAKIDGITRRNNIYHIEIEDMQLIKSEINLEKKETIIKKNNAIIEKFYEFAFQDNEIEESESKKSELLKDFCQFLLDDSNGGQNSALISAFILKNNGNLDFERQVNLIKEGVVIYQGLNYDNTPNAISSWKKESVYFLETEILFHFAGYNGTLFQEMAMDFFNMVSEINEKTDKPMIQLKYFKETKEEIEAFFNTAEDIIRGKIKRDPTRTAMNSIIEGCQAPYDIAAKKSDFFRKLNVSKIVMDDYHDYYEKRNHDYNLEGKEGMDEYVSENIKGENYLRLISHINVRRKGYFAKRIQDIKYLLISENHAIQDIAHTINKSQGHGDYTIPHAMGLAKITNKLWVQLSKGLGHNEFPVTFQVITKAQIVLSKLINNSVAKKYEELTRSSDDQDTMLARYLDLRQEVRKPEEILENDSDEILDKITHDNIISFKQKSEIKKLEMQKLKEENDGLNLELGSKNEEVVSLKSNIKNMQSENKQDRYNSLKTSYEILLRLKKIRDSEVKKRINVVKSIMISVVVILSIVVFSLIIKFGWAKSEPYLYFLTLVPSVFAYGYMVCTERKFSFSAIIASRKSKIINKTNTECGFSEEEFNAISKEKKQIENDLNEVK